MPSSLIALLGAAGSGRHALLAGMQPHLGATSVSARVIEDERAWAALTEAPALVLLLPAPDSQGEAQDLQWRARLAQEGIGFSVLHGGLPAQLATALQLIENLRSSIAVPKGNAAQRWTWCCDNCSDADCEHRLFKDLLQSRVEKSGTGRGT